MEKLKQFLFCTGFIDWTYIKSRMKKYSSFNWPELTTYCGCCAVPIGIYIRSVVIGILSILTLVPNTLFLSEVLVIYNIIVSGNTSLLVDNWAEDELPDRATIVAIYKALLAYHIVWITFRAIYVLFVLWIIYAVYSKHPRKLKITLFLNVPLWLIEFFLSFINLFFIGTDVRIIIIISHISELYNILAIRSYYMKLRGKSRLVANEIMAPSPSTTPLANDKHCGTCTCPLRRITLDTSYTSTQQSLTPLSPIDTTSAPPAHSPPAHLNLDLPLSKVEPSDDPVIYDKAQLNVGSSPVLEDKCTAL